IHSAINAIDAKKARTALVIGVEKMTEVSTREAGNLLLRASYHKEEAEIEGGFAGVFGHLAQAYFQKYGDQSAALAKIAAKNHANGVHNPYAQMRKDLGFEFCNTVSDKNPLVAGPLRRTDCSLISDGAAAMVLTDLDRAWSAPRAIGFRAASHVNDFLPLSRRDKTELAGAGNAWRSALGDANLTLDDLSFVETHDCFTIAELMEYEAMGLAKPGEGHRVIDDGITQKDGRLPVNPSGGLKAKGHPVGSTGVSMHAISCMQLMNEADEMQIKDAKLAGIFNMGGSSVANYVSILERLR
ncbi:MAG: thiolase domain-containing protein, partial [Pseudomonadota bacterium]